MEDKKFFRGNPGTDGFWADGAQELALDDLENVAGGAGSGSEMAEADGRVTGNEGNGSSAIPDRSATTKDNACSRCRHRICRSCLSASLRTDSPDRTAG